jgi:RNA polymerase sigma-70 factor (ECF subfamily)
MMGTLMGDSQGETDHLVQRLRAGDRQAVAELFDRHRDRLRRMIELRMDPRLQARLDPSDVLQDAFLQAARRVDAGHGPSDLAPFLWLRLVVGERLVDLHRHHLGAQMRDAGREASSAALASLLLGRLTSPTRAAIRAERAMRLQEALNSLDPIDREVLALRHFEQLSRAEAAQALGIAEEAAAKRYIRALKRLKAVLAGMPGGLEGL